MHKKEIPFDDIYDYIHNNLDPQRMAEVEKSIIDNDESEDVFHMMVLDYQSDIKYIDSLIGEDYEKNEKIFGMSQPKFEKQSRCGKNQQKNNIMETQNYNVPENFEAVKKAVEQLKPSIQIMISAGGSAKYEEYAVKKLIEDCQKDEAAAQKTVQEILAGIEEFDKQYAQLQETGKIDVESILETKSEAERKQIMLNSVVALKALRKDNLDDDSLESLLAKYQQKSTEELVNEFETAVNEGVCFQQIVDSLSSGIETLTTAQVAELKEMIEQNSPEAKKCRKFYTALAMYIANYKGALDLSVDESGVDAGKLGMSAAAAIEFESATAELEAGEIELPDWALKVKCIFAALMVLFFVVAVGTLVGLAGYGLMFFLMSMFGQGVFSTIVAFAITIPVLIYMGDKISDFGVWLAEKLEAPYDKAFDKFYNFMKYIGSLTKQKVNEIKEKVTGTVVSSTDKNTAKTTIGETGDANTKIVDNETDENLVYA